MEHSFNSAKKYTITASLSCANCDESINVDVQSDPTISIDAISNEKPVVGDTVSISGGTTYAQGFFVTIDWGDNSGSDRVKTDSDGIWGPVNHSFDPAKKYTITASLFCDPDNPCSVSDSRDVDVQPNPDPTTNLEPIVSSPTESQIPTPPPIALPTWLIAAIIFVIGSVVVGYVIHHSKKSNYQKSHPRIEIVTQGGVEK